MSWIQILRLVSALDPSETYFLRAVYRDSGGQWTPSLFWLSIFFLKLNGFPCWQRVIRSITLLEENHLADRRHNNAHFRPPLSNCNYYSVYEECCQILFCWITKLCSQQREKNITDLYNQHDHRMSWICTKIPNISHFIMLFTGFLCCLFYSKQCIHLFII